MLNGRLTNLQYNLIILLIAYYSKLFPYITVDCSSTKATLPLATEVPDQGRYCVWNSYDQSILNFKERDIPIALIFTIDHNLTPIQLKQVLDIYHAIACLLPNDSSYLYAAVLHLPKNPKLYFGKLLNTQKLHQSIEDAGQATKGDKKIRNNSCYLILQTINIISKWLTKPFLFEKVIKHIILINDNDHTDQCILSSYSYRNYQRRTPNHWLIDMIILNTTKRIHPQYELKHIDNFAEELKNRKSRNIFEGSRLLLSNAFNQSSGAFANKMLMKKSLIEFLREIVFESVIADAIFSIDLTDNWIKYNFEQFKKYSQPKVTFVSWTWLLKILRVMFFIIGTFVIMITTCALCGFTCILSTILREDYHHQRQMRAREEEFRFIAERIHEAGINIHFDPSNDRLELHEENGDETNTAIEQLSLISETDLTQLSTIASQDNDDEMEHDDDGGDDGGDDAGRSETIIETGRSEIEQCSVNHS